MGLGVRCLLARRGPMCLDQSGFFSFLFFSNFFFFFSFSPSGRGKEISLHQPALSTAGLLDSLGDNRFQLLKTFTFAIKSDFRDGYWPERFNTHIDLICDQRRRSLGSQFTPSSPSSDYPPFCIPAWPDIASADITHPAKDSEHEVIKAAGETSTDQSNRRPQLEPIRPAQSIPHWLLPGHGSLGPASYSLPPSRFPQHSCICHSF